MVCSQLIGGRGRGRGRAGTIMITPWGIWALPSQFSNYGRDWKEAPRNARSRKVSERASESVLKTREGRRRGTARATVASVLGVRPSIVHARARPIIIPCAFLRPRGYLFVRNYAPTAPLVAVAAVTVTATAVGSNAAIFYRRPSVVQLQRAGQPAAPTAFNSSPRSLSFHPAPSDKLVLM